ncbi:winged helix-turn-helix domain-containing protein, partial [Bacteroides thetaiotaomicron]
MDKHIIGENAGTLWQLLNEDNRKWELTEIKEATGFDDMELASAIGWLAREDKIQFELNKTGGKPHLTFAAPVYLINRIGTKTFV